MGLARGSAVRQADTSPTMFTQVRLDLGGPGLKQWLEGGALKDFLKDCELALLINNAGVVQPVGALADQQPATVGMAVALNVAAPLMLSAAVAAEMAGRQSRILHVSSGAGRNAYPGWSVYCATKAALDHHARAVVLDAAPGVRICSLAPGVIDTGMQAEIRATPQARFPMRDRFLALKNDGALAQPEDCARDLVNYLLAESFGQRAVDDVRNQG
jgi:NAD(P)-dependent dehydrogenase (short-subunit alcohol dehydrogenase family)